MSRFFIERPIFATVLAIIIVLAGLVAANILPIAQYPEIAPPTVTITASYPGASAETLAKTVAAPIEEQLSGVENLLYFNSTSASNGSISITGRASTTGNTTEAGIQRNADLSFARALAVENFLKTTSVEGSLLRKYVPDPMDLVGRSLELPPALNEILARITDASLALSREGRFAAAGRNLAGSFLHMLALSPRVQAPEVHAERYSPSRASSMRAASTTPKPASPPTAAARQS